MLVVQSRRDTGKRAELVLGYISPYSDVSGAIQLLQNRRGGGKESELGPEGGKAHFR